MRLATDLLFFVIVSFSLASTSFGSTSHHHDPGEGADGHHHDHRITDEGPADGDAHLVHRSSHLGDAGLVMLKLPQWIRTVSEVPHLKGFLPDLQDWLVIQGGESFIEALPEECSICLYPVQSPAAVHVCDARRDHIVCAACLDRCPDSHHCPSDRRSMKRRQNRVVVEFANIGKPPERREEYREPLNTRPTRNDSYPIAFGRQRRNFVPGQTRRVRTRNGSMMTVSDL